MSASLSSNSASRIDRDPGDWLPAGPREKFLRLRQDADDAHAAMQPIWQKLEEVRDNKLRREAFVRTRLERFDADSPRVLAEQAEIEKRTAEIARLQSIYDERSRDRSAYRSRTQPRCSRRAAPAA